MAETLPAANYGCFIYAHSLPPSQLDLLKKSEMQEPSRALWSPRVETLGMETGVGEMPLSSQETAHEAKLIPRPSSRCPASAHPVPGSLPPSLTHPPDPLHPAHSQHHPNLRAAPSWGPSLALTGPSEPPGLRAFSGQQGEAVAEGRAGAPGEGAASRNSISDLPSSGRYEWDSGRR